VFVSIGLRFEAQVEAMNMVETVGNYARHRKVPYIIYNEEEGRYRVVYVPAISGESIAHAYQYLLAQEAKNHNLKVCEDCLKGELFKTMDLRFKRDILLSGQSKNNELQSKINKIHEFLRILIEVKKGRDKMIRNLKKEIPNIDKLVVKYVEEKIVENCVVEDIGGFLVAEDVPTKRTSVFQVSYAIPVKSAIYGSILEPQLHARQSLTPGGKEETEKASEQMIFYVEVGTAVYGLIFNINLDRIGVSSLEPGKKIVDESERKKRMEVAIKALIRMISSQQFGAKLSRFFPNAKIKTLFVAISEKPFVVSSPLEDNFMEETLRRVKALKDVFNEEIRLMAYSNELEIPEGVERFETPEEVLKNVLEAVK